MKKEKTIKENEDIKFKGKYISSIGRRKTSIAQVRLYKKGSGIIIVNRKKINQYFSNDKINIIKKPLKLIDNKDIDLSILVKGGGSTGQAEAIRLAVSKVLSNIAEKLRQELISKNFLTRDARKKERKKPGLKKARRAPQWSKR